MQLNHSYGIRCIDRQTVSQESVLAFTSMGSALHNPIKDNLKDAKRNVKNRYYQ